MAVEFPKKSGSQPQRPAMFRELLNRHPAIHDSATKAAMKQTVEAFEKFLQTKARIAGDDTITDGAKIIRTAKAARGLASTINLLDVGNANVQQQIGQLKAAVAKTYTPENPTFAQDQWWREIRSHIKSMPTGERINFVEKARAVGDMDVLMAVASKPAFASGVEPKLHETYRAAVVEAYAPDQSKLMAQLQAEAEHVELFRAYMLQSIADAADLKRADELAEAARDDLAAA